MSDDINSTSPPAGGSGGPRYEEGGIFAGSVSGLPASVLARPVGADGAGVVGWARLVQRMPMPMSRLRAVIELALVWLFIYFGLFLALFFYGMWPAQDHRWFSIWSSMGMGIFGVLTCVLILRTAGHKAVTIGLTFRNFLLDVAIGVSAFGLSVLFIAVVTIFIIFIYPEMLSNPPAAQEAIEKSFPRLSFPVLALMTLTVAFWEEYVFRGFVLTRLQALFKRWWLTVPIGSLVFGLVHLYEGILAVLVIFVIGGIMGGLFVWRRSLVAPMAFHFMHNLVMFLILGGISTTWK